MDCHRAIALLSFSGHVPSFVHQLSIEKKKASENQRLDNGLYLMAQVADNLRIKEPSVDVRSGSQFSIMMNL